MLLGSILRDSGCRLASSGRASRRDRHVRAWLTEVNIAGQFRDFSLRVEQSGLQADDVLSELVVLCLESLVIV